MRRVPQDDHKKLVPLKRIAQASSYSLGYVSILVQRKKLKAKKIGNKYYTTKEWFQEYLELHARDEKRLPVEAAKELSLAPHAIPSREGGNDLKNQIDSLKKKVLLKKPEAARPDPSAILGTGEKKLEEILNEKIVSGGARLIADLVEPEIKLADKWEDSLIQETKIISQEQTRTRIKINRAGRKQAITASLQKIKTLILAAALTTANILNLHKELFSGREDNLFGRAGEVRAKASLLKEKLILSDKALRSLADKVSFFTARIIKVAAKIKSLQSLLLKGANSWAFKPVAVSLILALAIPVFGRLAPETSAGLSLGLKNLAGRAGALSLSLENNLGQRNRILGRRLETAKELATKTLNSKYLAQLTGPAKPAKELSRELNFVIPGGSLISRIKSSLDLNLNRLADQTSILALSLENNLKQRNRILGRRLKAANQRALLIVGFWQGQYDEKIKPAALAAANKYGNLELAINLLPDKARRLGEENLAALRKFLEQNKQPVEVAGKLTSPAPPLQGEQIRGRVAGESETFFVSSPFMPRLLALANTTSRRSREALAQAKYNTASLLENTAGRQVELSLSLGQKLAKLTRGTAEGVSQFSQGGKNKLAQLEKTINQTNDSIKESGQTGQSYLAFEAGRSLWSLSDMYSRLIDFLAPDSLKNKYAELYQKPPTIVEKEIIRQTTVVKEGAPAAVKSTQPTLPKGATANLSITGNADVGAELNVGGPATFKDKLTVLGESQFFGDVTVNAALTAKTLIVVDSARFEGSLSVKDFAADSLTSRNGLTVVGDAFVGGDQTIQGNLKVAGTFQAGHTEFSSLGVTGSLGAVSLSAGAGGLSVSGNTNLSGDSTVVSGVVTLNNSLNINKAGTALTVGDGSANVFTVDTQNDTVTIAGVFNLNGNTQFGGNMNLTGGLNLDVASTSALTVGNGVNDNFKIDTINSLLAIGYASTTDQITINGKQLALNSASTTTALLINYDGAGDIMQIMDNGVERFNMADFGITTLTASSTAGAALTVRQNGAGDILNLYDGAIKVLTVLDGGNVGIGTDSPTHAFELSKNVDGNVFRGAGFFNTGTAAGSYSEIYIGNMEANDRTLVTGYNISENYGYLQLYGDDPGVGLVITNGGSIGIGAISINAGSKLHVNGDSYFNGASVTTGQGSFTYSPQTAGESNIFNSSLYINPAGAVNDANLLGIADNGNWRFRVDKEGDVFVQGNLTTIGVVSQSTTSIIGDLTVEGHSAFGDAPNNDYILVKGYTNLSATSTLPALTVIQGSTGNILNLSSDAAPAAFIVTSTGSVGIGTSMPGAKLDIYGNAAISATFGSELAPAITEGNWSLSTGWQSPIVGGILYHNGTGVGSASSTVPLSIVAGTTYKVVITTGNQMDGGEFWWFLGGVAGTKISAANTTYTDYITASTTANFTIIPTVSSMLGKIASISVIPLTNGTGNLTAEGSLTTYKPATFGGPLYLSQGSVIYKDNVPFIHNFEVPGTYGKNTFVGKNSGNLTMTTVGNPYDASSNVGVGFNTLSSLTTGYYNVAVGTNAMRYTAGTMASYNTALGYIALQANITGQDNVAIGAGALNKSTGTGYNTSVGTYSLAWQTTGERNTAFGWNAGTGDNGALTDEASTVDTHMLFLGWNATRDGSIPTATVLDNGTAIGYMAKVKTSNSMVLGGTGAYAVKVGIGTASPSQALDVAGNVNLSGAADRNITINSASSWRYTLAASSDDFRVYDADNTDFIKLFYNGGTTNKYASILSTLNIKNNGNVGIGTTSPLTKLSVQGTAGANDLLNIASSTGASVMYINNAGNVGIGTTAPGAKLEVNHGTAYSANNVAKFAVVDYSLLGQTDYLAIALTTSNQFTIKTSATISGGKGNDFAPHNMTTNSLPSPYVSSASSELPAAYVAYKAFDGHNYTYWLGTNGGVDWLKLDIGSGNSKVLYSYAIRVNTIPEPNRAPKNWTMEGSTDNVVWDVLDTQLNQITWSSGEIREFTIPSITTAYRYYRLNVTANNGDGTYTQVAELYLYESLVTPITPTLILGAGNNHISILPSGNVGIGTTSPLTKLSVQGTAGANDLLNIASSTGASVMYINDAGNVGIGTTWPTARLHVNSKVNTTAKFYSNATYPNILVGASDTAQLGITWDTTLPGALFQTYGRNFPIVFDGSDARFNSGGTEKMRLSATGNVGIGTTSPSAKLDIYSATPNPTDLMFKIASSTGVALKIQANGAVYSDMAYNSTGADYAEYFKTADTDLAPGETVCVDVVNSNSIKRCERGHDNNIMGIVSSNPSIIGNARDRGADSANYKVIGMLGQIDALVSAENGPISAGDSLTSASSTPGYAMKADGGDSTVGIALEPLKAGQGKIKVLISRRNKSLAVEQVESLVVERIASMKIEDKVQQMITESVDNLNLDPKIEAIAKKEAGKLDAALTVGLDNVNGVISNLRTQTLASLAELENRIMNHELRIMENANLLASATALAENIKIDESGNLIIGNNPPVPLYQGGNTGAEPKVKIMELTEIIASSTRTALVVNQTAEGDIADFQAGGVSIINIASSGEVKIVGSLLVDGRIMLCSGGYCSDTLDAAVDETMADLGVEGKVVAGAFEGYCDDGYVWAPGSAKYGTLPGFCVMSDLSGLTGLPQVNVSQGEAQYACNALGMGYHLISENEWLTLAENILQVSENDLAAAPINLKLTNDNVIYNLTGDINQWISANVPSAGLPVAPSQNGWFEYNEVVDFKGLSLAPAYYLTDAVNHIGKIKTGAGIGLRGFVRGEGGIYGLDLSHNPSEQSEKIGFRCAK